jgi:formylglycine-generating enzyme required for sulfatase activity
MVNMPAGHYLPMFPGKDEAKTLPVVAYRLDVHAVTNEQFMAFVKAKPRWRRSQAVRLFADGNYLRHWLGDFAYAADHDNRPVTNVSWFAARAYAKWAGKRLPTLAEWEYAASASETNAYGRKEKGHNDRILRWYAGKTPSVPSPVGSASTNYFGVKDMHGLIWEWVEDFNSALVSGESRGDTGLERSLFCGAGSIGAADPSDYAAFMRFAFRSSLEGAYTGKNLGFRCAMNLKAPPSGGR